MKNEYKITKKLMISWAKEYYFQSAVSVIVFILWCLVGLIGLALIILSVSDGDPINLYLSVLFLVLSIFKLFFSRFITMSNRYKIYSKTYGVSEWTRTTEFTDDEIIVSDHTSVTKLRYGNIKKLKEKGNVIAIFMEGNLALRLYKDSFIDCTWEDCKSKIESMIKK